MQEIFVSVQFQMSLLLFTAVAGYLLAARLNQSAVVGEILVGLIIGPSLLGLVTYTDFVQTLAELGAVILLFVVGMEFRPRDILDKRNLVIALFGVLVPWIAGFGFSRLFGYNDVSSVFIGTALTATSIAITANVLKEMGKLKTDTAKAIIGSAVIDDVLGLLALSITGQVASGAVSVPSIGIVIIESVVFFLVGIFLGNNLFKKLIVRVDHSRISQRYPEIIFVFAIMLAFFYGMIAELIGLSAIVGAFIAGVSIGDVELKHSKSYKEGAEYLQILFSAIFFISLGVLTNLKEINISTLWFLLALVVVAVLTKIIGCYIPARMFGMPKKEALAVGVGMMPRGEVAMIVALVGLNRGIIGQDIYVPIVMMSLITTIITPFMLKRIYRDAVVAEPTLPMEFNENKVGKGIRRLGNIDGKLFTRRLSGSFEDFSRKQKAKGFYNEGARHRSQTSFQRGKPLGERIGDAWADFRRRFKR